MSDEKFCFAGLCLAGYHCNVNPFYLNSSICFSVDNLSSPEVLEKLEEGQVDGTLTPQIESACVLLSYLADALHAINTSPPQGTTLSIQFRLYVSL